MPRTKRPADLIVTNIGELLTMAGPPGPRSGAAMSEVGAIADAAVAVTGYSIAAVGPRQDIHREWKLAPRGVELDARGKLVLPGFVDPHTHLVFAGSREDEFTLRLQGATYLEILQSGGGILNTVKRTRAASEAELIAEASEHLQTMVRHGTTTVEAKSGYGLDLRNELKQLRVIAELRRRGPLDLVATFLGAHAVPPEFAGKTDDYVEHLISVILPAVAAAGLAEFCDVFCEHGVFDVAQSRRILEAAIAYGLRPKLHADEMVSLGGAELAADLGAVSADHLLYASDEGIRRMAARGTVAVLLPGTPYSLGTRDYARAREMIAAGVPVALATDFNPGTSYTESMPAVMELACRMMRLSPAEALVAATHNAAHAIGRAASVGTIEPGKQADLIICAAPNHRYLPYHFGVNAVETVVKRGRVIVRSGHYTG
ncbi:MAG: imidazolonepropionase [Chloroflexota bacterium]